MIKKLKPILPWLFGSLVLGLLYFLLIPKAYDVESFHKRPGTTYWNLETGSKIGYTKIAAVSSEKKRPIIYLHGGPGGLITDKIIEALKPLSKLGHELYFYDQIGSGHSSRLDNITNYTVKRHQEDLRAIISTIKAEKVILIGQSWGAVLAINFLQDYSEYVEKVILTGPGSILPINRALFSLEAPDSLALMEPQYSNKEGNEKAYNQRMKLIQIWAYISGRKLGFDKEVDHFFTYLNRELSKSMYCTPPENRKHSGGGGYYSHIMTVKSFSEVEDKRRVLSALTTPILILRGQCDNQKWGFTKEYVDLFQNSRLEIIPNVGHDLIYEKRTEYVNLITEFLLEEDK